MRLKVELDQDTAERLMRRAVAEQRPLAWQAEVMLRRSLAEQSAATPISKHFEQTSGTESDGRAQA
jgi:hypothetical protein